MSRYLVTTLNGSGVPSSAVGVDTNTYTDNDTDIVYDKQDGAWVQVIPKLTTYELTSGVAVINYPKAFTYSDNAIYVRTASKVYASTDSGVTWSEVLAATNFSLAVGASNRIFVGLEIGFIKYSDNDGSTWSSDIYVGTDALTYDLANTVGLKYDGTYLYAAVQYCTQIIGSVSTSFLVYRSADNGVTWSLYSTGLTDVDCDNISLANGVLFFSNGFGSLWKLSAGTWTQSTVTTPDSIITSNVVYHNSNYYCGVQVTFAVGESTVGLYKSTDSGSTFAFLSNPGSSNYFIRSAVSVGSNLIVGTNGGGVLVSTDSGATFTNDTSNIPLQEPDYAYIYCLVNPFNTTVFAGVQTTNAIYKKTY